MKKIIAIHTSCKEQIKKYPDCKEREKIKQEALEAFLKAKDELKTTKYENQLENFNSASSWQPSKGEHPDWLSSS